MLRDLRPYVCTYQDYSEAIRLFDTRQDWVAHEDSCHRRIRRCLEHPEATFLTVGAYKHHIEAFHASNRTELQSTELLRIGESASELADRPCPICLTEITDASRLQYHIAAHLIRIALFALPRSTDIFRRKPPRMSGAGSLRALSLSATIQDKSPDTTP